MQSSYLINHSLELRFAFAIAMAAGLFVVVKLAYFIDETLTKFLSRNKRDERASLQTACAAAAR